MIRNRSETAHSLQDHGPTPAQRRFPETVERPSELTLRRELNISPHERVRVSSGVRSLFVVVNLSPRERLEALARFLHNGERETARIHRITI